MATPVFTMGSDSRELETAAANCSFCAVGGLFNKSAQQVMATVFGMLGKPTPTGSEGDECGEVWVRLYEHLTGAKVKAEGQGYLDGQIKGICKFVEACRCKVGVIGNVKDPLRADQIVEECRKLARGTAFLLLTADDDGLGMAGLAHWVSGQVQEDGSPKFFDYQLKFSDGEMLDAVLRRSRLTGNRRACFSQNAPYASDRPLSPWGAELDKDDGRGVIITVTK